MFAISGCRREADEIWALLSYYAAYSANSLPTFRYNLSGAILKGQEVLNFFTLDDGTYGDFRGWDR